MPSFVRLAFVIRCKGRLYPLLHLRLKLAWHFSLRFVEQDRFLARCCLLHRLYLLPFCIPNGKHSYKCLGLGRVCWYSQKASNGQNTPCIMHRVRKFRVRYRAHVGEFLRFLQWTIHAIKSHGLTPFVSRIWRSPSLPHSLVQKGEYQYPGSFHAPTWLSLGQT